MSSIIRSVIGAPIRAATILANDPGFGISGVLGFVVSTKDLIENNTSLVVKGPFAMLSLSNAEIDSLGFFKDIYNIKTMHREMKEGITYTWIKQLRIYVLSIARGLGLVSFANKYGLIELGKYSEKLSAIAGIGMMGAFFLWGLECLESRKEHMDNNRYPRLAQRDRAYATSLFLEIASIAVDMGKSRFIEPFVAAKTATNIVRGTCWVAKVVGSAALIFNGQKNVRKEDDAFDAEKKRLGAERLEAARIAKKANEAVKT